MIKYAAVCGKPIDHSLSPVLHKAAYQLLDIPDYLYVSRELDANALAGFIKSLTEQWRYLSLTMPLKRDAYILCDYWEDLAVQTQVVNTFLFSHQERGKAGGPLTVGINTDVLGIYNAFANTGINKHSNQRALIFGTGATACSAVVALKMWGVTHITFAARSIDKPGNAYLIAKRLGLSVYHLPLEGLHLCTDSTVESVPYEVGEYDKITRRYKRAFNQCSLVVQTLPAPVIDKFGNLKINDYLETPGCILDVVYSPIPRPLANAWQQAGGVKINGLEMLVEQAIYQILLGCNPDNCAQELLDNKCFTPDSMILGHTVSQIRQAIHEALQAHLDA